MSDAFVARQPIFNHKLEAVGYELLWRGGYIHEGGIGDGNPEGATARVILNLLTELDFARVVGQKLAWINAPRDFVVDGLVQAIPPNLIGLDIPEEDLADAEMVEALRDLKAAGYKLALDDFQGRPGSDQLVGLFDIVKLNMLKLGRRRLTEQVLHLKRYRGTLLAQGLETREAHEFCAQAGCDLFQGYFFCQPSVVATRRIAPNRLALLQVIAALHRPDVQLADLGKLISHDVALSFRLLRYVNSAYFGLRGEVRSMGQALALLGIENVRRWATLTVLATIDDKPSELTTTALIRARFCELAGPSVGITGSAELFTLGLFSVLDAMMDAPMQDVVASLPLAEDVREALSFRRGIRGRLLDCVVALEVGRPDEAQAIVPRAGELYLEALMWANTAVESLLSDAEPEKRASAPPPAETVAAGSKPPPGVAPSRPAPSATITDLADRRRQPALDDEPSGWFRRLLARLRAWFRGDGLRASDHEAGSPEPADERHAA
jgi:EAL and modified HD-GYP domain-containing signal transduction protein